MTLHNHLLTNTIQFAPHHHILFLNSAGPFVSTSAQHITRGIASSLRAKQTTSLSLQPPKKISRKIGHNFPKIHRISISIAWCLQFCSKSAPCYRCDKCDKCDKDEHNGGAAPQRPIHCALLGSRYTSLRQFIEPLQSSCHSINTCQGERAPVWYNTDYLKRAVRWNL